MPDIDKRNIQKILVIKLRAIGDVLLSTVVLPNLRAAFPDARIDFLAEGPSRDILEGNPYLDDVIIFRSKHQSGVSLVRSIRSRRYDLVIDLFGNPRSAIVTLFSGARYRAGFRLGWRERCYNIIAEPRGGEVHNTEFNLDALRRLEIPIIERKIIVPVTAESEAAADRFFADHGLAGKFVVALNPGGGWYTKRWPPERYGALADRLHNEDNAEILLTWGPGEEKLVQEIAGHMATQPKIIPLVGLKELASILKRCTILVTNDSGPMHIAAAMGTPIVGIYGPTRPVLQGPFIEEKRIVQNSDVLCLGCNFTECPIGNPCMHELPVDTVLTAFRALERGLRAKLSPETKLRTT